MNSTTHARTMDDLIGDLVLRIAFALLRHHDGYLDWTAPELERARQMMCYRWN
jgi:hypothetical protein